ncbi:MAG: hypothetical protein EPO16_00295 [Dehalococcoidia bacterium]|nr:MAG: hypothetical protein EPO16_00295 [Dehalococcoidia bacterium]
MSNSTRWLAGIGAAILLAVVAGLVITVTTGRETTYPEGTPERVVQDYLHAVSDRDATAATSFLSPELAARCSTTYRDPIVNRSAGLRATLDRATVRGDKAEVQVRITETYGAGPFGSNESTQNVAFNLTKSDAGWRISEAAWPLYCPPSVPAPVK